MKLSLDLTIMSKLPIHSIKRFVPATESWTSDRYQLIKFGEDEAGTIRPQLLLLFPNEAAPSLGEPSRLRVLQFRSAFLDACFEGTGGEGPIRLRIGEEAGAAFDGIWRAASGGEREEWAEQTRLAADLFKLIVALTFPEAEKNEPGPLASNRLGKRCSDGKPIVYAARYIKKNYDRTELSLNEIANAINYNPNYFCSEFTRVMGISPMKYVNKIRIERALYLLRTTDESIHAICRLIGMNNLSLLSSQIKRSIGMTPSEYRRSEKLRQINAATHD